MSSGELKSVLERIKEIFRRMSWRIPKMVRALGESQRERERKRERERVRVQTWKGVNHQSPFGRAN